MAEPPGDGDGGDGKVVPIEKKKKKREKRTAPPGVPCYTFTDAEGDDVMVSNFRARLLVTFDWPDGSRTYRVNLVTAGGETSSIELDGWLMATRTRLNSKIGGFGSPVIPSWLGNDIQLSVLRQHLSAQVPHCPRATRVEHYGLTKIGTDYIWAFGNVAVRNGEVVGPNDDGIFQFSDGKAVSLAEWCSDHDGGVARAPTLDDELPEVMSSEFMTEAVQQFDGAWGDAGLLALGWAWALQFRAICMRELRLFPYLYLHGATGGGKTSLAHAIGSVWYGRTEIPEVDLPERGVPSMGTFRGFERTMASEILSLLDEAGPNKVKHCTDLLKRMATGTAARRARRNDRADTRVIVPRSGVMLTANGRVGGEEALLRRCVVLNLPRLKPESARESDLHRRRLVGKGWRMSSYLLHHIRKLTGGGDAAEEWYVSPKTFMDAVRGRVVDLGNLCGSDQIAVAYAIAEVGLTSLLLTLNAIDRNIDSTAHFNRDRLNRFSAFVVKLCQREVSGRGETSLPGSFFGELESSLVTGEAPRLQAHCWTRDVQRDVDGSVRSGVVWLRLEKIGHVMKGRPGTGQAWLRQWSGLLDELAEVDYLAKKDTRVRPPPSGGTVKPSVRGMWGFEVTDRSPDSLKSLAETLCDTQAQPDTDY
jgi:hypothetical protein